MVTSGLPHPYCSMCLNCLPFKAEWYCLVHHILFIHPLMDTWGAFYGCSESCDYEHGCANLFWLPTFNSFGCIYAYKSVAGSHNDSIFNCLRSLRAIFHSSWKLLEEPPCYFPHHFTFLIYRISILFQTIMCPVKIISQNPLLLVVVPRPMKQVEISALVKIQFYFILFWSYFNSIFYF